MSAINYDFKIGNQNFNLLNIIRGTEQFEPEISGRDLKNQELCAATHRVIAASSRVFHGKKPDEAALRKALYSYTQYTGTDNQNLQNISHALRVWIRLTSTANNPPPFQPAPIEQNDARNTHKIETSACSREGNGMSCFVNTVLQIIANIPTFSNLFNKKLEKLPGETKAQYDAREAVRGRGASLLRQLMHGNQNVGAGDKLRDFIEAVNRAADLNIPGVNRFDINGGDDAYDLMETLEAIVRPTTMASLQATTLGITITQLEEKRKDAFQAFVEKNHFPPVLRLTNLAQLSTDVLEKITLDNGVTYQLQAVINRKNHHTTPSIRTETGDFVIINDMSTEKTIVSKQIVLDGLKQPTGWRSAYYVKVEA